MCNYPADVARMGALNIYPLNSDLSLLCLVVCNLVARYSVFDASLPFLLLLFKQRPWLEHFNRKSPIFKRENHKMVFNFVQGLL